MSRNSTNRTNRNEDFISKLQRFGKATQEFEWFFKNPLTSFLILLVVATVYVAFSIPMNPIVALVGGFIQLVSILKGTG